MKRYNVCQILDRGVFPVNWTSYRLRSETIYFDTDTTRFELKRYAPTHPRYSKNACFCLSAVKNEFVTNQTFMKQGKVLFTILFTIDSTAWLPNNRLRGSFVMERYYLGHCLYHSAETKTAALLSHFLSKLMLFLLWKSRRMILGLYEKGRFCFYGSILL